MPPNGDISNAEIVRRLQKIEDKLGEKVVYRDVYEVEQRAIREAIANATTTATRETDAAKGLIVEKVENVEDRVDDLEDWRKTIYALIATNFVGLLVALIVFLVQRSSP